MSTINAFVLKHIRTFEMIGVVMRIFSFSLVSWLGPSSPFMFVWVFNTMMRSCFRGAPSSRKTKPTRCSISFGYLSA